ncbi:MULTISPECIES: globin domain-containing protein [Streptomyces]|uniref:globin domain-containing protein n=1 Tax=Streptomyces TaxID=1883 RepID=UPI001E44B460|nr:MULTISPECIES: globin domain-containing protein [Streptomyces]UFQ16802.1 globin domain-containing protein [Streptomyces huasconensis]WCL86402.1 globin domain-containing protein [Streptomyces sp. JCM 35825]
MDAPTTTSADDGTSGGGSGWFTPRRPPRPTEDSQPQQADADGARQGHEGRRPAFIRPLGRPESPAAPTAEAVAVAERGEELPEEAVHDATEEAVNGSAGGRIPAAASTVRADAPAKRGPEGEREPEPVSTQPTSQQPSPAPQPAAPQPTPGPRATPAPQPTAETAAQPQPPVALQEEPQPPSAFQDKPKPPPATQSAPPPVAKAAMKPSPSASPDAALVQRTMAEIGPVADQVTSYFYALLFTRHPDLRPLFPAAMDTQRDRLLKALLTAAEHIDHTDVLVSYLKNLGRGHRKYGTRPEHYPAVGECLIGSLSRYASAIWDEQTEAAWVRTYTTISQVMIDAAAEDELRAPAWWFAEVVSHDLRTPDIAVVTVRPDQPYPFLAGQYTSLETPWWPRIWRHYSFASAPRSDGLLSFHVKAVPAGWVSNALVHHARPGDVLRLGPPGGSMTVDHTTDSGLLCLGGGTGIAPIKALVEDVAEHGRRRPVEVFYGARTDHDLYDIDTMLRLQQSHPWLSVRPIVDQRAQLPDAVREYGPWDEYDAYLSGPPGMIRSGVDALRDAGVPEGRIRHDSVEELVLAGE